MKNKQNGIFSPGLYLEGIRQSRYIGLPFLCLAVLLELYHLISYTQYSAIPTLLSLLSFCTVIPLCVLSLFHFLNSRAASDYYHSIPRKRSALYVSFAASAMTWAVGTVLLTSLLHWMIGLCHGVGDGVSLIRCCAVTVICCFIVLSACLLGMTLTGTLISQIATIGIILFLPRILILLVEGMVCSLVPTLPDLSAYIGSLGNFRINMLFDALTSIFGSSSIYDTEASSVNNITLTPSQMIYTIVLGLIYFLGGLRLFNTRKSEKASYPATSPVIQAAVRVLIAFTVCLIGYEDLTTAIFKRNYHYIDISSMLLIAGFALLSYFLYEIVTSRSIHSLRNSWKSLLIGLVFVAALIALMIGGTIAIAGSARDYLPNENKVKSITVTYPDYSNYVPSYFENKMSRISFDDPETVHTAVEDLALCSKIIREDKNLPDYFCYINYNMNNGRKIQRQVYFNLPELIKFSDLLSKNPERNEAINSLPENSEVSACYLNYNYDYSDGSELKGNVMVIWETLRSELEGMSYDKRHLVSDTPSSYIPLAEDYDDKPIEGCTNADIYLAEYRLGDITIAGTVNGSPFKEEYAITPLTPKTADLYMRMMNASSDTADGISNKEALEILDDYALDGKKKNYNIYLSVDGGNLLDDFGEYIYTESQEYSSYHYDEYNEGESEDYISNGLMDGNLNRLISELIRNYSDEPECSRPIYRVSLTFNSDETGQSFSKTFYVNADMKNPVLMQWISYYY